MAGTIFRPRALAVAAMLGLLAQTVALVPRAQAQGSVVSWANPENFSCAKQTRFGFELFQEGHSLSATSFPGIRFTTTNGYSWRVGDFASGNYNGKYPNGAYTSKGTKWAWLGPQQGSGRIDFIGGRASSVSVMTSTATPVTLEAYDQFGSLIDTAGPSSANVNTGSMDELRIQRQARDISYVVVHDSGNYFLIDELCTDAPNTTPPPPHVVAFGDSMTAGHGVGESSGYPNNSLDAYPSILARSLNTFAFNFARSGACAVRHGTITGTPRTCTYSVLEDELARLDGLAAKPVPQVIVMSVGINDINFPDCLKALLVGELLGPDPCQEDALRTSLIAFEDALERTLRAIRDRYPTIHVGLLSYYNPFPPPVDPTSNEPCELMYFPAISRHGTSIASQGLLTERSMNESWRDHAHLAQGEIWLRATQVLNRLDESLDRVAAKFADVQVVRLNFNGHDWCQDVTADPWVYAPLASGSVSAWSALGSYFKFRYFVRQQCANTSQEPPGMNPFRFRRYVDQAAYGFGGEFALSLNCFPHPTPHGQSKIAAILKEDLAL